MNSLSMGSAVTIAAKQWFRWELGIAPYFFAQCLSKSKSRLSMQTDEDECMHQIAVTL
jgi:hypothetical protein